ncbi:MAG: GGDEF domain-containing protein [Pseudomonadota bacterium]
MEYAGKESKLTAYSDVDFRRPVLIGLLAFVLAFLGWHSVAEYLYGIRMLAIFEGAFACYSLLLLYFVIKQPYSKWLALALVVPGLSLILLVMFHPDTPKNAFIWIFLVPVLTYSLLGRYLGFLLTLFCSILALISYLSKYGNIVDRINLLIIIDVVICMSIIWVISHLYERYREMSSKALHLLATTDELTGLYNRRQMEKAFKHLSMVADRQQQLLAVVVMDLDHFKKVNDQWGHDAGDAVLVHVAKLLRDGLRQSDWAFRTGGEEFCLLLPVEGYEGAIKAADTVRQSIADTPCHHGELSIPLSASIGIALYPNDGSDYENLLQLGDQHMYRAKEQGRNRIIASN